LPLNNAIQPNLATLDASKTAYGANVGQTQETKEKQALYPMENIDVLRDLGNGNVKELPLEIE